MWDCSFLNTSHAVFFCWIYVTVRMASEWATKHSWRVWLVCSVRSLILLHLTTRQAECCLLMFIGVSYNCSYVVISFCYICQNYQIVSYQVWVNWIEKLHERNSFRDSRLGLPDKMADFHSRAYVTHLTLSTVIIRSRGIPFHFITR